MSKESGEEKKAEQLAALLDQHRGERHIIVIQSFPDPDAISSALAHQMIAARREIECDIAYDGVISHPENVALVELLQLRLMHFTERDDLRRYQGSIFVDNQGTTSGLTERLSAAEVPVLAIIDHHEPQGLIEAEFTDIRTNSNATATIYTEYLESDLLRLERANPDHERLATALMHGIRSETHGLVRAAYADFQAAAYLAEFVDQETLATILSNQRSRNTMDVIQAALAARVVRDSYSVAGVGYLRYEDRDAIPQAADFLLTEENVHTAIVYGLVVEGGREMLVGSLRTKKATFNPDTFLKEALGGPEAGRYYGGGRREAGGFEIAIGFLAGSYDDEFMQWKWRLYDEQLKRKLWARLGVERLRQPRGETLPEKE
ncbi:MAG TPA: bifunctional oligoribonuclease/PAP phosphatase NrnA [Blastocatellia bacterium]|nr:bifunctional oligoribonuclease/PAP phosphatase NrnA [Blastocatellia bacterium]